MSARVFYEGDASLDALRGRRVAVLGYGSQGRPQALNLSDSGIDVIVGLRPGSPGRARAERDGLAVADVGPACSGADLVALLIPDRHQPNVYRDEVASRLKPGSALLFAHGFNIRFGTIRPPGGVDVLLVGPKAPGPIVRTAFGKGLGVPAVVAVEADETGAGWQRALAYAKAIGCTRAGVVETTFAEETETDLFGEQAVLAGGVGRLIQAGFEVLVEAGYSPEVAYFECLHEMRLVVELLYRGGYEELRSSISEVARYGSLTRGREVIGDGVKAEMERLLGDIRSGAFFREWSSEAAADYPETGAALRREAEHLIEKVGPRLRAMMPELADGGIDDREDR